MTDVGPWDNDEDDVDYRSSSTVHNTHGIDGYIGSTLIENNLCPPLGGVTTVKENPKEISHTDDGIGGHGGVDDISLPYPSKDANKHQTDRSLCSKGSNGI